LAKSSNADGLQQQQQKRTEQKFTLSSKRQRKEGNTVKGVVMLASSAQILRGKSARRQLWRTGSPVELHSLPALKR
jgi:hypothetical protein